MKKLGRCPLCNKSGIKRESRPNGNDMCVNGHLYFSSSAVNPPVKRVDDTIYKWELGK